MVPGTTELLIIFGVIVLLFGASKLPKLGGAIGESIRNFKKGIAQPEDKSLPKESNQKTNSSSGDIKNA